MLLMDYKNQKVKKVYSYMYQAIIISIIMIISKLIEGVLPFVMPSSVIGLMLLFIALCTKVIKLEQVEPVGNLLVDNISLLFVPAGISVITSIPYYWTNYNFNIFTSSFYWMGYSNDS